MFLNGKTSELKEAKVLVHYHKYMDRYSATYVTEI